MRRILRRREIVADDWLYAQEISVVDAPAADSLIVPWAELRASRRGMVQAPWRLPPRRLGVRLSPADQVEELAAELPALALIAIEFPGPGDGRGFSQARLLRSRLAFAGELRAVGAGVKQDLMFLMGRCGFDSYELAAGQSFEAALAALGRYSVAYQPGAPTASIRAQRYHV
ncbi:MAG TPA: DUF934 domain-containing protein [Steroidobacteraceae bacterium]